VNYKIQGANVGPVFPSTVSATGRYERLLDVPGTTIEVSRNSCTVSSSDTVLIFGR
jgi:hypothetical protein